MRDVRHALFVSLLGDSSKQTTSRPHAPCVLRRITSGRIFIIPPDTGLRGISRSPVSGGMISGDDGATYLRLSQHSGQPRFEQHLRFQHLPSSPQRTMAFAAEARFLSLSPADSTHFVCCISICVDSSVVTAGDDTGVVLDVVA